MKRPPPSAPKDTRIKLSPQCSILEVLTNETIQHLVTLSNQGRSRPPYIDERNIRNHLNEAFYFLAIRMQRLGVTGGEEVLARLEAGNTMVLPTDYLYPSLSRALERVRITRLEDEVGLAIQGSDGNWYQDLSFDTPRTSAIRTAFEVNGFPLQEAIGLRILTAPNEALKPRYDPGDPNNKVVLGTESNFQQALRGRGKTPIDRHKR